MRSESGDREELGRVHCDLRDKLRVGKDFNGRKLVAGRTM